MRSVVGFDGSTVVERTPHNQEFAGLNPTECWAFSFLRFTELVPLIGNFKLSKNMAT